jgi:hypothetical protein
VFVCLFVCEVFVLYIFLMVHAIFLLATRWSKAEWECKRGAEDAAAVIVVRAFRDVVDRLHGPRRDVPAAALVAASRLHLQLELVVQFAAPAAHRAAHASRHASKHALFLRRASSGV